MPISSPVENKQYYVNLSVICAHSQYIRKRKMAIAVQKDFHFECMWVHVLLVSAARLSLVLMAFQYFV